MAPLEPRIPPLPAAERDDKARELLAKVALPGAESGNIFTTLIRHPRLFRRWLPFAGVLLDGSLPVRERELLILRTAHNCGSPYEWGHHVRIGRQVGLDAAEIERVREGPDAAGWSNEDALVLRAADELHKASRLSDSTWDALAARFDEHQLIELPMLVGHYHLLAFTLNSLGVEFEGDD